MESIQINETNFLFSIARQPLVGQGLLMSEASRSHSDIPQSVGLPCTKDQPATETSTWEHIQHSQEADIHAPDGIRTRNPSKRVAADPQLKRRDHLDRQINPVPRHNF